MQLLLLLSVSSLISPFSLLIRISKKVWPPANRVHSNKHFAATGLLLNFNFFLRLFLPVVLLIPNSQFLLLPFPRFCGHDGARRKLPVSNADKCSERDGRE